tara:strand:- start:411 stop:737 length:327 start_codon:yes stop_codon:yes gene_type:complete
MSLAVGSIIVTLMKYKVGDIVLVRSSAGEAIPRFHVKLVERIVRNPPKDPSYIIWRAYLTRQREADILRKEWSIPFKFPNDIETLILETNIIRKERNTKKRKSRRRAQ